jgi:hypothetical protein
LPDVKSYPDPIDWITKLHAELLKGSEDYYSADGPKRRRLAARQLASVLSALMELPPFRGDQTLHPLKDVLIFFDDLDLGRKHPWSVPTSYSGTSATTTSQNELHSYVRVVHEFLTNNGFSPKEAFEHIATGLQKTGRTGKNGSSLPWRTVQSWCRKQPSLGDTIIRQNFERFLRDMEANIASVRTNPPMTPRIFAALVSDKIWALDHLRDRINSVGVR